MPTAAITCTPNTPHQRQVVLCACVSRGVMRYTGCLLGGVLLFYFVSFCDVMFCFRLHGLAFIYA
jgi:hypothetical protein